MSNKVNAALDRRTAIRFGAVGAAATAATAAAVATATDAQAAAGQAVLQGRVNTPGATDTSIIAPTPGIAFTVKNTGTGAAGYFFAAKGNGFAGGTAAGNKVGLSTANTGPASSGAAMGANGINNTGVLTSSMNPERFAIEATNFAQDFSDAGGAVLADGGLAGVGLLAFTAYFDVPAVLSSGDTWHVDGGINRDFTSTNFVELDGVTSVNGPEVTFSGQVQLSGGLASVQIPVELVDDLDLSSPVSLVSPNTGAMPNLWITTSATGAVSISGGVGSGTVSYRVVAQRSDVATFSSELARSTQRGSLADVRSAGGKRQPKRSRTS